MSCTGYTSGSDLQGETAVDTREDSRDSRTSVPLAEKYDETPATSVTEWNASLSSKQIFGI